MFKFSILQSNDKVSCIRFEKKKVAKNKKFYIHYKMILFLRKYLHFYFTNGMNKCEIYSKILHRESEKNRYSTLILPRRSRLRYSLWAGGT